MSALSTNSYQLIGESLKFEKKKCNVLHLNFFGNVHSKNLTSRLNFNMCSKDSHPYTDKEYMDFPYSLLLLRVEYGLGEIL